MFRNELNALIHILDESPFFTELPVKDKEALVRDLVRSYPQLIHQSGTVDETSWFTERFLT